LEVGGFYHLLWPRVERLGMVDNNCVGSGGVPAMLVLASVDVTGSSLFGCQSRECGSSVRGWHVYWIVESCGSSVERRRFCLWVV
jgi:hypothetical protein